MLSTFVTRAAKAKKINNQNRGGPLTRFSYGKIATYSAQLVTEAIVNILAGLNISYTPLYSQNYTQEAHPEL